MNNKEFKDFKTRVLGLLKYLLVKEEKFLTGGYTPKKKETASIKVALLRDLYDNINAMNFKD